MTDLDPEIWENKTLGAAAPNENLDVVERQNIENRAAKFEDREPRVIVNDNTYPGWTPEVNERTGTVPSNYQTVHFADENPNDIPVDSGRPEEDAGSIEEGTEETPEGTPEETQEPVTDGPTEDSPEESNSNEETGTTQWT